VFVDLVISSFLWSWQLCTVGVDWYSAVLQASAVTSAWNDEEGEVEVVKEEKEDLSGIFTAKNLKSTVI
jgi:hypothetical protein